MTDDRTSYGEHVREKRLRERENERENRVKNTLEVANKALVDANTSKAVAAFWYLFHDLDMGLHRRQQRTVLDDDRDLPYHFLPTLYTIEAVHDAKAKVGHPDADPLTVWNNYNQAKLIHLTLDNLQTDLGTSLGEHFLKALETCESVAIAKGMVEYDVTETYALNDDAGEL